MKRFLPTIIMGLLGFGIAEMTIRLDWYDIAQPLALGFLLGYVFRHWQSKRATEERKES